MFENEIPVGELVFINGIDQNGETWAQVIMNLSKELDRLREENANLRHDIQGYENQIRQLVNDIDQFTIVANAYMNAISDEMIGGTDGALTALRYLEDAGRITAPKKTVTLRGEYIATHRYEIEVDIPIFDDESDIDHEYYAYEIGESVMDCYDPSTEIIPE